MTPYKLGDGSLTIEDDEIVLTFDKKRVGQPKQVVIISEITGVELKKPTSAGPDGYLQFISTDTPPSGGVEPKPDLNTLTLANDEQYEAVLAAIVSGLRRIAEADEMAMWLKCVLGTWITVLSAVALGHLPWAWTIAERLKTTRIRVHWFRWTFTPQLPSILLLIVVLTAVIGSCATLALTFSQRAGHGTLQRGWAWWYFTRPFTAAGIGVLAYALLGAGFISMTNSAGKTDTATSGLLAAAAVGGLAGLFTDQLLQKMSKALGLTDFKIPTNADKTTTQPPKQP